MWFSRKFRMIVDEVRGLRQEIRELILLIREHFKK